MVTKVEGVVAPRQVPSPSHGEPRGNPAPRLHSPNATPPPASRPLTTLRPLLLCPGPAGHRRPPARAWERPAAGRWGRGGSASERPFESSHRSTDEDARQVGAASVPTYARSRRPRRRRPRSVHAAEPAAGGSSGLGGRCELHPSAAPNGMSPGPCPRDGGLAGRGGAAPAECWDPESPRLPPTPTPRRHPGPAPPPPQHPAPRPEARARPRGARATRAGARREGGHLRAAPPLHDNLETVQARRTQGADSGEERHPARTASTGRSRLTWTRFSTMTKGGSPNLILLVSNGDNPYTPYLTRVSNTTAGPMVSTARQ